MGWSEIKKAINSDLNKPLNILVGELLDNEETGLATIKTLSSEAGKETSVDEIETLLKNTVYGLNALKDIITSNMRTPFRFNGFSSELGFDASSVSTLPYSFYLGGAVLYKGEIHILGGNNGATKHYKWNGSSWVSVSTLPYNFYYDPAIVFKDEIHIVSSWSATTSHYKWDGTSWTSVSTLPYELSYNSVVIYDDMLHMVGGYGGHTKHYRLNGTTWESVSTLPFDHYQGQAIVYNNEIHIMGSNTSSNYTKHYKWDGVSWSEVSVLPYNFYQGRLFIFDDEIHMVGSGYSDAMTKHYKWDGKIWTEVSTLPYAFYNGCVIVSDDGFHLLGGSNAGTNHYKCTSRYTKCGYLPSGVKIYHCGVPSDSITTIENCTKQSDGSLLVNSNGVVEFKTIGNDANHYSIY